MRLLREIAATWAAPGKAAERLLASGAGEERALGLVMGACGGMFVLRLPLLLRAGAGEGGEAPLAGLAVGAALGLMVFAPLALYGLAALSHVLARLFGGRGSWLKARLVLFWSLVSVLPLVAVETLVRLVLGPGPVAGALGFAVFAAFVFWWLAGLRRAEFPTATTA